jgi:hypothetical protein
MKELLDAFWRALAYCLHPRVIGLSLLPLLIGVVLSALAWWLFWDAAVAAVAAKLQSWTLIDGALQWLERVGGGSVRTAIAPALVLLLALPLVVVVSVLLVGLLMTPAIVSLVAGRRFPRLERRHGAGLAASVWVSLSSTVAALVLLLLSIPLWFVPPLVLVLPPLIWGWLTYRVMSHDALSEHADAAERRALLRKHRWSLWGIGIATGYLGAAPSLLWALSVLTVVMAPVLIPLSVWLYTLVFAFSALWFVHYCLAALQRMRDDAIPGANAPTEPASLGPPVRGVLPPPPA